MSDAENIPAGFRRPSVHGLAGEPGFEPGTGSRHFTRPRLLDLFCGAGGCSVGYARAGFDVVGVDVASQSNYPFEFVQADALEFLTRPSKRGELEGVRFDAVHASPPCQFGSKTQRIRGNEHPNLIEPVRERLQAGGLPYVIENVPDAHLWLRSPIRLEGQMFGLNTRRPRLFETSWPLEQPLMPSPAPQAKMGRRPKRGEAIQIVGHFTDVQAGREAMGIDWMTRDELSQAIPPAYCEWIGLRLLAYLAERAAA